MPAHVFVPFEAAGREYHRAACTDPDLAPVVLRIGCDDSAVLANEAAGRRIALEAHAPVGGGLQQAGHERRAQAHQILLQPVAHQVRVHQIDAVFDIGGGDGHGEMPAGPKMRPQFAEVPCRVELRAQAAPDHAAFEFLVVVERIDRLEPQGTMGLDVAYDVRRLLDVAPGECLVEPAERQAAKVSHGLFRGIVLAPLGHAVVVRYPAHSAGNGRGAAESVGLLDHQHVGAQFARDKNCRKPGGARTDDQDIGVEIRWGACQRGLSCRPRLPDVLHWPLRLVAFLA